MKLRQSIALVAVIALGFAACATGNEEGESKASRDDALGIDGSTVSGVGGLKNQQNWPVLPPPPFPPSSAVYCANIQPTCSVEPQGAYDDVNAELASYGCSPAQHWMSGTSSGVLGGIFSLCNDSAAVRQRYTVAPPYDALCTACIPEPPPGEVYTFLEFFVGPNCPHNCDKVGLGGTLGGTTGESR